MIKSEADDLPPPPKLSTSALDAKNVSKVSKQSTSTTTTTTSSATAAAASITKRRPRTSHIWNYSTINPEEGITLNHDGQEVWVCSMCKDKKTTYLLSGGTAAPIKHLLRVHKIEPCISAHSRPRRHGKHNSESSITLSSSTNASLYKNELHAQQYIVAPPPLLQQQLMPLPPHLLAQQQALDLEDQFVFPMTAAATAYSLPATPITSEFMPSPFVFPMPQQQPQMAMSAATTAAYPMMAGSDCGSSSNNSTVETPIMSSDESASSSPSSTTLKTAATTPASPGFSSSNVPTDPEMLVPTQHPEVNVDGAIKSLLEMVIQYDIPASLIESPSFKNFCISLNPNAVSALPALKSTLSTSTSPSSTTATTATTTSTANTTTSSSPTSSTPTNTCSTVVTPMFTNYTYTSSNSQSGCPPNAYAAQMQWVVPQLDVMSSGLVIQPESLVSDQQFQNDYLW